MVIDFHTHIFPDKIANKTIDILSEKGGIPPFSDGTAKGLIKTMDSAGVDISVNLPVVTNPSQFDSVNRFALQINESFSSNEKKIISFAGIHPLCENIDSKMRFIKDSGFLGIKIHPDYQGTFINDENYVRIIEYAKEYDLVVVTHSGADGGYKDQPIRCTPDRVLDLIDKVPYNKLVLAHYGANEMFDEVFEKLCEADVYFDTAYILRFIDEAVFKKILKSHGEERILFASDSPWSDVKNDADIIKSFSLGKETEDKIFYGNAKKLLGL